MKKYTASQIIERALNLADISNTDFLTHTENTQYLNDAWRTVFEWLISKGDKQFVKEVELSSSAMGQYTEYELPDDFYQMFSLRSPSGGLIPRKAESESDYSASYDIVNDRLRLYGVSATKLILTYYQNPIWITYPDKDIEVDTINYPEEIYGCYNNSVAVYNETDESIILKNVITGETIADISFAYDLLGNLIVANGHIGIQNGTTLYIYDYSGNEINTINDYDSAFVLGGMVCYIKDGNIYDFDSAVIASNENVVNIIGGTGIEDYFYNNSDGYLVHYNYGEETEYSNLTNIVNVICHEDHYTLDTSNTGVVYVTDDFVSFSRLYVPGILEGVLNYGVLYYNGYYTVKSSIEDTEFNFPNDMYFSLLACDLALRYTMKMDANTDGLNNLYSNMQSTFMNTLSQTADYSRIKNVYGRGY